MSEQSGIIKCYCGMNAIRLTSQKNNENQGKQYWKCAKRLDACRFFKWDDPTMVDSSKSSSSFSSPRSASSVMNHRSSPMVSAHRHSILSTTAASPNTSFVNRSPMNRSSDSSGAGGADQPSFFTRIYNSPASAVATENNKSNYSVQYGGSGDGDDYQSYSGSGESSGGAYSNSKNNDNNGEDGSSTAPLCPKHQVECIQRITRKEGPNKGRPFWTCPKEQSCHFVWADSVVHNGINAGGDYNRSHASVPVTSSIPPDQMVRFELCSKSYATVDEDDESNEKNDQRTVQFSDNSDLYVLVSLPDKNKPLRYAISCLFEKKSEELSAIKRNDKQWMFPYSQRDAIKNIIRSMPNTRIFIQDIPDSVVSFITPFKPVNTKDDSEVDWSKFPASLVKAWRPFQKEGVIFGISRNGRCLIGDEMGLGKTMQAMSIAYYFKENWPLLIICPATLRYNWSNELEKWLGIYPEHINVITSSHIKPNNKINIISYELAAKNTEDLLKRNFGCAIVDESHNLKNQRTDRVKNIRPLLKNAERVILITGTPALSRPIELYPQIDLVMQGKWWLSYDDFSKRYCEAKETTFGIDRRGSSNLTELNYLLSRTVMIRRRKNDVLTELPTKNRQYIHLCVEDKDLKSLKSSASERKSIAKEMMQAKSMEEHEYKERGKNYKWLEMFNKTGTAKLKAVRAYVSDLLDKGVKFLIFGFHLNVLDGIEEVVKKSKTKYIRIDGSTAQGKRQKLVDEFRHNSEYRVAILSITAAGVGLTFTPCSTAIFAELYWTPGTLLQAEDRVHRIGQTHTVTIQYLLAKGTLDDELWPLIQRKIEILGETLDAKNEVNQWDDSEYSKYEGMDQTMATEESEQKYEINRALDDIENFDVDESFTGTTKQAGFFDDEDDNEIILEDENDEQEFKDPEPEPKPIPARRTESPKVRSTPSKGKAKTTAKKTSANLAEFFFQGNTDIVEIAKQKYEGQKSNYVFKRSFFSSSTESSSSTDTRATTSVARREEAPPIRTARQPQLTKENPVKKSNTKPDDSDTADDFVHEEDTIENESITEQRTLRPRKPITLPFSSGLDSDDDDDVISVYQTAQQKKKEQATKPVLPKPATPKLPARTKPSNPETPKRKANDTTEKSEPEATASPFAKFMFSPSQSTPISSRKSRLGSQSTPLRSTPRHLFASTAQSNNNTKRVRDSQEQKHTALEDSDIEIKPGQEFDDIDFDAVLDACNLSQMPEEPDQKRRRNNDDVSTQSLRNDSSYAQTNDEESPPVKFFFGL